MIQSYISGSKIYSVSSDAFSLYEKSLYGEKKENRIEYAIVEALFLFYEGKMVILSGNKIVKEENLLKKLRKIDKKIETKFTVFQDLRKKGYILKTALKFGAEFRVYEKGVNPGEDHAKWILYTAREHEDLKWQDFTAKSRIAHSTRKNLLIALVDEENDVTYYEVKWIKP